MNIFTKIMNLFKKKSKQIIIQEVKVSDNFRIRVIKPRGMNITINMDSKKII